VRRCGACAPPSCDAVGALRRDDAVARTRWVDVGRESVVPLNEDIPVFFDVLDGADVARLGRRRISGVAQELDYRTCPDACRKACGKEPCASRIHVTHCAESVGRSRPRTGGRIRGSTSNPQRQACGGKRQRGGEGELALPSRAPRSGLDVLLGSPVPALLISIPNLSTTVFLPPFCEPPLLRS